MARQETCDPAADAWADAWMEEMHEALSVALDVAGRGSVKGMVRALRIGDSTFRTWRREKRIETGMLFRILWYLRIDPRDFWGVIQGPDPVKDEPIDPVQADLGDHSLDDRPAEDALYRFANDDPFGVALSKPELTKLDHMRDGDHKAAVEESQKHLRIAAVEHIPGLLAIYGSAMRAAGRLQAALQVLRAVARLAEEIEDKLLYPDALQRLGVAHAYAHRQELGLLFARAAEHEHRLAGNTAGAGRALVDQGLRYFQLKKFKKAIAAFKLALSELPQDEERNRYSATVSTAYSYHRLGDLRGTMYWITEAEKTAKKMGQALTVSIIELKAETAVGLGKSVLAEELYEKALELYRKSSPLDAAVVVLKLALLQQQAGQIQRARLTVTAMTTFVEHLAAHKELILEIMRRSLAHGCSIQELEQVKNELERARQRAAPTSG